jgi:uncharacterized paraquat-inducible protein A
LEMRGISISEWAQNVGWRSKAEVDEMVGRYGICELCSQELDADGRCPDHDYCPQCDQVLDEEGICPRCGWGAWERLVVE